MQAKLARETSSPANGLKQQQYFTNRRQILLESNDFCPVQSFTSVICRELNHARDRIGTAWERKGSQTKTLPRDRNVCKIGAKAYIAKTPLYCVVSDLNRAHKTRISCPLKSVSRQNSGKPGEYIMSPGHKWSDCQNGRVYVNLERIVPPLKLHKNNKSKHAIIPHARELRALKL